MPTIVQTHKELPIRKLGRDGKLWTVETRQPDGGWIAEATAYQHKTSAYALLGRLYEKEAAR